MSQSQSQPNIAVGSESTPRQAREVTRSRRFVTAFRRHRLASAGLSFLGLGMKPPTPSWAHLINLAQSATILQEMPWLWVPPGVLIAIAVLSINVVGDGLRDALDSRVGRRQSINEYLSW